MWGACCGGWVCGFSGLVVACLWYICEFRFLWFLRGLMVSDWWFEVVVCVVSSILMMRCGFCRVAGIGILVWLISAVGGCLVSRLVVMFEVAGVGW